jgi:hypothetical protein
VGGGGRKRREDYHVQSECKDLEQWSRICLNYYRSIHLQEPSKLMETQKSLPVKLSGFELDTYRTQFRSVTSTSVYSVREGITLRKSFMTLTLILVEPGRFPGQQVTIGNVAEERNRSAVVDYRTPSCSVLRQLFSLQLRHE